MTDFQEPSSPDVTPQLIAIFGEAEPGTIFSKPEPVGDALVFTASAWERAGGFGFGSGYGSADGEPSAGSGGGGGGASQGRPVAVIRVSADGIQVKPVLDFTKIGITVVMALVGVLGMQRRLRAWRN
jgi:uncharacterized spore protein YtfJ